MYHEYIPKNSNEIVFALKIKQGVHKGKNTKFLPQFFFQYYTKSFKRGPSSDYLTTISYISKAYFKHRLLSSLIHDIMFRNLNSWNIMPSIADM